MTAATSHDVYADPIPPAPRGGVRTGPDALARYLAQTTNAVGMCLRETRTAYGIGSRYPDAATGWRNTRDRYPGDTNPPVGAPVWWTGGPGGYGHVAIYAGNGNVRSSDAGGRGLMGTRPLGWFRTNWGLPYAGWSRDLNGVTIPGLGQPPPGPAPDPDDTTEGWKDADMVLVQAPTKSWWMLSGGVLCSITAQAAANARAGGIPAWAADGASWDNIVTAYPRGNN